MNKRLCLLLALAMTGVVFAAEGDSPERRVDNETYEILAPSQPGDAGAALAQPVDATTAVPAQDGPLAELRARHVDEYQSLAAAAFAATDNTRREALEARLVELKTRQAREELEFLRQEALSRGDATYAARLDEALRDLTPAAAPVATTFVPRDPATGRALDGREGGAQ